MKKIFVGKTEVEVQGEPTIVGTVDEIAKHTRAYEKSVSQSIERMKSPKAIAKRDFVIHWNDVHIEIKKGDDLDGVVPEMFFENLKTEQVI